VSVLPSPFDLPSGRLLALDLGQARHGVAVCDEAGILATPLTVVPRRATRVQDFTALGVLVNHERAVGVLIGLPLGGQTGSGRQARWVQRYAGRLAATLPVPVAFWDESFSTQDAERLLASSRTLGGSGSTPSDAVAAALILQDFLEARRGRDRSNQPGDV
jgi:putative Holliday junction resolvase